MGSTSSTFQQDILLSHLSQYVCYHVQQAFTSISENQQHANGKIIKKSTFVNTLRFPCTISGQIGQLLERNGHVNWRDGLGALLVCVGGKMKEKVPIFLEIFDLSERDLDRETFSNLVTSVLHTVEKLAGGSSSNLDSVTAEVTASVFSQSAATTMTQQQLMQWASDHPTLTQDYLNLPPTGLKSPNGRPPSPDGGARKVTCRWQHAGRESAAPGDVPASRSKHAACQYGDATYIHGGKAGNVACRDTWRWNMGTDTWSQLSTTGERPPPLEGHTMLPYRSALYVFGGNFSSSDDDTPLWMLDLGSLRWRCPDPGAGGSEVTTPGSRRYHTAVIHRGTMTVFGGYVDLKGSTNELWTYDLEHGMWHFQQPPRRDPAAPRHGHSAIVHGDTMWVVGGMTDLQPRDDVVAWNFPTHQWLRVKSRGPEISGHTAVNVGGSLMLVFGGTTGGAPQHDIWTLHYDTLSWQRLSPVTAVSPVPRWDHAAVLLSPFVLQSLYSVPASRSSDRAVSLPQVGGARASGGGRPYSSPGFTNTKVNMEERKIRSSGPGSGSVRTGIGTTNLLQLNEDLYNTNTDAEDEMSSIHDDKKFRNRIVPVGGKYANEELMEELENVIGPTIEQERSNKQNMARCLQNTVYEEKTETVEMITLGGVQIPQSGFFYEKKNLQLCDSSGKNLQGCDNSSGYEREASVDEVLEFNDVAPRSQNGSSHNEKVDVEARGNMKGCKTDLRRHLLSRQSSSVESVTLGFAPKDGVPLLKQRCNTMGNISLDSNSGYMNPSFDYSRNNSREDHTSQVPIKKLRSNSQFSDDFVPIKYSSQENILNENVNVKCPRLEQHVKTGSVDSLLNDFGGVQVSFESTRSWSRPRSKSKSYSVEDLILEDIEDCDIESMVPDTTQSHATWVANSDRSVSVDQSCNLLQTVADQDMIQSDTLYYNAAFDSHSFTNTDEGYPASISGTSTPFRESLREVKQGWQPSTDVDQSQPLLQQERVINSKSKTAKPCVDLPVVQRKERRRHMIDGSDAFAGQLEVKVTPTAPNFWHIQRSQLSNTYHMYVLGGKEVSQGAVGFSPLSMWRLEIHLNEKK